MCLFHDDVRQVIIQPGSDYWNDLNCDNISVAGKCQVNASDYVSVFFGGLFSRDHIPRNAIILGGILLVVRVGTFVALSKLTYSGK